MKTKMSNTSLLAYRSLEHKETQVKVIYECFKNMGTATNRMVAQKVGMEPGKVGSRVNAMKKGKKGDDGNYIVYPLVELVKPDIDPVTGKLAQYWKIYDDDNVVVEREYTDVY